MLVDAIAAAHAEGARVTAHVFGEDALPGLINAGIDCIEHGTGITDDIIALMLEHGTALVPTLINIENFPGIADAAGKYPTYAKHMRDLYASCRPARGRRTRGGRADLRGHRRRQHGRPRPHRRRGRRAQDRRHEPDRCARRRLLGCPRLAGQARTRAWRLGGSGLLRRGPSDPGRASTTRTWCCCAARSSSASRRKRP